MKKKLISSALAGLLLTSGAALAGEKGVAVGYADVSASGMSASSSGGLSLKAFGIAPGNDVGFIASTIISNGSTTLSTPYSRRSADTNYYSASVGPIVRINRHVHAYGLGGVAWARVKPSGMSSSSKTGYVLGGGVLVGLTPNLQVDLGYEKALMSNSRVRLGQNVFSIAGMYRF